MVRYFSTQRPVSPGSYPRGGALKAVNFEEKTFCEEIGREAWGVIEYAAPLPAAEAAEYELTMEGTKTFWCVTTSVDDRGRVRAAITGFVEDVTKPENSFRSLARKDIYNDWFSDHEEAVKYVEEAKMA